MMRLDPLTGKAVPAPLAAGVETRDPAISPDGRWAAFTRTSAASEQIWIKDLASGKTEELAGGSCNNSSPAWELDSSAVIFASDCGRAFGLPVLYRAPISRR
jgi:Tol biopolymer transport system component